MSIQSHPAIFGVVLVGTITGQTVFQVPYEAPAGTHAAPAIAGALDTLWHALPSALAAHGAARFDFLVRQAAGDPSEPMTDVYWASGMTAGSLFSTVARKLVKVRAALPAHPAAQAQREGCTVTEHHNPNGGIDWVPPQPVDHTARALAALAHVSSGAAWAR